jgi:hypothetical protein
MLAMTSIAVTASICASASEAALLVASFTFISLNSGMIQRCAKSAKDDQEIYSEHPTTSIRFRLSPHSANIDCAKVEQQCGGILTLERFRAKWIPVRVKKTRQNNNRELGSIRT